MFSWMLCHEPCCVTKWEECPGGGGTCILQIPAPNDAAASFIVYNYAKNALNVQVVRSKETKFCPDCIFLTLCAGKSAFSPVSPVALSQCPCLHQEGTRQRHICSVKNILNLNRSWPRDIALALGTRDTAFKDFIWLLLWKIRFGIQISA